MKDSFRGKVLSGLFWQYFQRIANQLVGFIVSIILARLLLPEDFGVVALMGVFITVSNIFIDSGFGNALIQRKSIDELDTSSVFYINLFVSFFLYGLLFIISPVIARYYGMPSLSDFLRVQAVQIIIMAFYCVQHSMLVRNMKFRINFYVNFTAVLISAIVGITLAYNAYGVWSLIFSQLSMQFVCCVGLWLLVGWRPKLKFSFKRLQSLLGYSSRILGGSLLHVIYNNVYNLVIGKQYTSSQLGYYNRGQLIPTIIIDNVANTINGVMFSALSSIQDDKERFLSVVRKMVSIVAFIVFLIVSLMLPLASDVISLLLTDKWLPSVPFMRIVCLTVCFTPFILINSAILTSLGESDKYLKTTIISKILSIILILGASLIGIYYMVGAGSIAAVVSVIVTGYWNEKLINYSRMTFLQDILPSMLLGCISACLVYCVTLFKMNSLITLLLGGGVGIIFYLCGAYIFKFRQIQTIVEIIRK
ncbi:lipopolysaccharide biosynthesis protein [Parabacteroides goldsteinii]|uniref:lipopolysaccharide biosynthesis protein n=1 Tax=Parabacteroides goldsteinii TaxID=328812 RepID=UPI00189B2ADE|nr:lipopolysaccharide biosynthesis protein [Parabacteroides goldsteinii]